MSVDYLKAVRESAVLAQLLERRLDLEWTTAQVLYDDPAKTLDRSARTDVLLFPALMERMGEPKKSFDIVSPYFVPGDQGTVLLADLARRGVKVRVLTNSLASSDERVVHAGYMKRRHDLLRAGVVLYELKPAANKQVPQVQGTLRCGQGRGPACQDLRGRRRTHLRRFLQLRPAFGPIEHRDGRGASTAGRVLVSWPSCSTASVPELAYEVRLAPQGDGLLWIDRSASGEEKRYDVDPETDWSQRFKVDFLADLPIDWLL